MESIDGNPATILRILKKNEPHRGKPRGDSLYYSSVHQWHVTRSQQYLDKTLDIPYFIASSALLNTSFFGFRNSNFEFPRWKRGLWGRNGFDGDKEAPAAYRAFLSARKTDGNLNIIADDYEYALAA